MSTMKKIFALALALAMVMTVAIFADFADKAQISDKCLDDVNTLVAIGLINGYEDGTVRPNGNITRAEACKMIYVLRNAGDDDGAESWKGAASFADVSAANWFSGYVAYCAQYNIVAGRSATTFDPNANVTSLELAKMLLVVAGYRADVQGYTGAEWASNVRKDAESAGLLQGYGAALTTAAPRQWACKMFNNTIHADMAVYYGDMLAVGISDAKTVGEQYLDYQEITGFITANENWAIVGNATEEKDFTFVDEKGNEWDFEDFTVADNLVGKQVIIAYHVKNSKNYIYGISENGKTVSGKLTLDKNENYSPARYTLSIAGEAITSKNALAAKVLEKFDDNCIITKVTLGKSEAERAVVMDGQNPYKFNTITKVEDALLVNSNESEFTAYDVEGDGDIDYIIYVPAFYGEVESDPTSTTLTVNFGEAGRVSFGDFRDEDCKVTYESGIVADDYVKAMINQATGEIKISKLNEVVIGTYSGTDEEGAVIIGGTAYEWYNGGANGIEGTINEGHQTFQGNGTSYTLYTDGKYILRAEQTKDEQATLSGKYAYLIDAFDADSNGHEASNEVRAKVLLSNGTVATLDYDTEAKNVYLESGYVLANYATLSGKVFQYSLNGEGKIRFYEKANQIADAIFIKANGTLDADNQTIEGYAYKYNDDDRAIGTFDLPDTAFFFAKYFEKASDRQSNTYSYKVVTAADIKSGMDNKDITVYVIDDTEGKTQTVLMGFIDYTALSTSGDILGSNDQTVVFITGKNTTSSYDDNGDLKVYIAAIDVETGAAKNYSISNSVSFGETERNTFYTVEENGDDYDFTKIGDTADWYADSVTGVGAKAITLANTLVGAQGRITADMAKNAKVFVRSNQNVTASSFAEIKAAGKDDEQKDVLNILYHMDGDDVDFIIFSSSKNVAANANYATWNN